MTDQVICALSDVFHRWMSYQQQRGRLVRLSVDENRPSPCCDSETNSLHWHPVFRESAVNLENLESALDCSFHPTIHAYFGSAFSGSMTFLFKGLKLTLVQPWNDEDFIHLQENLVAHILMLKKLKLPITFFLATVSNEQRIVSLDNETGAVILEQLGQKKRWVLANDLSSFLQRLSPVIDEPV